MKTTSILSAILLIFISAKVSGQGCCSGGSGSPIAGGTSQGVLLDRQAELSTSYQYINSNKFLTGDKPAMNFLNNYHTKYLYSRFAYGITKDFTLSIESGYYFNKTQVPLGNSQPNETNKGIGDLIIFPRYDVYNHNTEKTRTEVTIGLGYKIPVGKYWDSSVVYVDPGTGKKYYTTQAPAVMPTTGSQDVILYGFAYRGYPLKKLRFFSNFVYIHKGWNPLGEKFGDYASLSLFAGTTVLKKIGLTLQLKGEFVDKMQTNNNIDMVAVYNLDITSTGGKKIILAPQINYSYKKFSVYGLTEIPIYQYVNGTAIGAEYLFTVGLAYRFSFVKMN